MDSRIEPNELVEQLIKENLRTKAPRLDLAYCGLQGDEPALEMLAECNHLKGLNLSDTPEVDKEKAWILSDEAHNRRFAYSNMFSNIQAIPDYLPTSLECLYIGGTQDGASYINDISNVVKLTKLKRLYLAYNEINDLSPLQSLTQLECLHLDDNHLDDLASLSHLTKLWWLDISINSDIKDLSPLSKLKSLRHLNADGCSISDLTPLQNLTELETLQLTYNHQYLGNLSGVGNLVNLRKLFVSGNRLSQLDALNMLHKLEVLELYDSEFTRIKECDFKLPPLHTLKELKLGQCELKALTLPHLPELRRLDVSDNQLTVFSPEVLARLPKLDELNLWGNPIENLPKETYNHANSLRQVKAFFAQNK